MSPPSFAYLFERFPSFTQTFCSREAEEMFRQRMEPLVISIRSDREPEPCDFAASLAGKVEYLPPSKELEADAKRRREERALPGRIARALGRWGEAGDKARVYEAIHLGPKLKARKVPHVHAHFAGIASRTAYWIKRFYGIPFSFTGHANDIFCETDFPVSLEDLVREAEFVATETDYSRDWLRGKIPAGRDKIVRVYNGIDVKRFEPAAAIPIPERPPRILSVGRYIEKKGFPDLIEACRILNEKGVEFQASIVGEGPLEEALRSQIAAGGLERRVLLAGPKSQGEILEMLGGSAVFVLPCVHEKEGGMDNLPTVIMEAMAAGIPVVSTPVAGVPEMVLDNRTGCLVPQRSAPAVAEAVERLLRDKELAGRFGANGKGLAAAKFATEVTTRELKHLLVHAGKARPGAEAIELDPGLKRRWRLWGR